MSQQVVSKTVTRGGSIPSPLAILAIAVKHRRLIVSLASREVVARYKGSMLGGLWTLVMPLLMLGLYAFVFGRVMGNKWHSPTGAEMSFALVLFGGLVFVNMFSECLARAPGLMMENTSYIKKVVFPLEILPFVALGSAFIWALASFAVLAVYYVWKIGMPPVTILWLPVVVAPLFLMALGFMWLLGSLGVYLRDLRQVIGVVITALTFFSPLFYSLEKFPAWIRPLSYLNPLTYELEAIRNVMYWGISPNWLQWGIYTICSWLVAWGGLVVYAKVHRGFADVV